MGRGRPARDSARVGPASSQEERGLALQQLQAERPGDPRYRQTAEQLVLMPEQQGAMRIGPIGRRDLMMTSAPSSLRPRKTTNRSPVQSWRRSL